MFKSDKQLAAALQALAIDVNNNKYGDLTDGDFNALDFTRDIEAITAEIPESESEPDDDEIDDDDLEDELDVKDDGN